MKLLPFNNLAGLFFGRLEVLSLDHKEGQKSYWKCKCVCGREHVADSFSLKTGLFTGCQQCLPPPPPPTFILEEKPKEQERPKFLPKPATRVGGVPARDRTGEVYGRWTVLKCAEKQPPKKKEQRWTCRCTCGVIKDLYVNTLVVARRNRSKCNCKTLKKPKVKNVARQLPKNRVGEVYGYWTVLKLVERRKRPNKQPQMFWLCRCVCGVERVIGYQRLRRGVSKSCGCKRQEMLTATLAMRPPEPPRIKDRRGLVYGSWTVLKLVEHAKTAGSKLWSSWLCRCECGTEKVVSCKILNGKAGNCGCKRQELQAATVAAQSSGKS